MVEQSGSRLLIIAVVCGAMAAGLTVFFLEHVENKYRQAAKPKQVAEVSVVVPKRDLAKGAVLTADSVAARKVPEAYLATGTIRAEDFKKVVNRTLRHPVQKGRPLTWLTVTGKAAKNFSGNVELGRRALSVKVSKIDSFDGLLRPGDRIDLLGRFSFAKLGVSDAANANVRDRDLSDEIIMPVLENVEVLSAGREDLNGRRYELSRTKSSADGFNMEFSIVSLNLTPKQIARAQLAESTGSVFAVLRNPKDTSLMDFELLGVDVLLQKDTPAPVDLVLGANGEPIGRVIGDNIVDANGDVVGKVVNGKPVSFDGKPLGKIIRNVSTDDPILRVAERADVVRDEDGKIIGRIVDGQILSRNGEVIGKVNAQGQAVDLNGDTLGTVERNVALDLSGNEVDVGESVAELSDTYRQQVVRDANGNIIGRVSDGKIINDSGKVIGQIDANGQAIALNGRSLGTVDSVLVDRSGNLVATETRVVRDAEGKVIGRVVNGQLLDKDNKVIGTVDASGNAVGLDGIALGTAETVMLRGLDEVVGEVTEVVRDENGQVLGRVVNGEVVDSQGNVIGTLDKNGRPVGTDGQLLGEIEKVMTNANGEVLEDAIDVIRDADGNLIGRLVDGQVVDAAGKVIGTLQNGQVVDASGQVIANGVSISTESPSAVEAERLGEAARSITSKIITVDFIAGGSAKDGIVPVQKIRLE